MKAAMRSQRDYLLAYGRRLAYGPSTPTSGFATKLDALIVLAAGDLAVLAWWGAIFLFVYRRPQWRWASGRAEPDDGYRLATWFASAVLMPFGRADLGASDAAKFLAISGVSPWLLAMVLGGISATGAILVVRYFRLPTVSVRVTDHDPAAVHGVESVLIVPAPGPGAKRILAPQPGTARAILPNRPRWE